jgi:adenosylcobinamide-phosphate synthase
MSELFKNPLLIGFLLDTLIGDPYKLPHPIRWFGNFIAFGEQRFNNGSNRKLKGALMAVVLIFSVWATLFFGLKLIEPFEIATLIVSSILVFYGLANHTLIAEALKVERKLSNEGLEAGRKQLSFIVGRDTSNLNENQIRTAVLETLAENLSDGVVAPLFFYALGGIPLMFAYKMVNTLDSMIGYKSDRYKDFGWFAARTDDWANLIPARLTALLMVLVTFSFRGAKFVFNYGRKHASPNSGYPESAMAGILNVRFGGSNVYHGQLVEKPYIGTNARNILKQDLYKACIINSLVAIVVVVAILALSSFSPQ